MADCIEVGYDRRAFGVVMVFNFAIGTISHTQSGTGLLSDCYRCLVPKWKKKYLPRPFYLCFRCLHFLLRPCISLILAKVLWPMRIFDSKNVLGIVETKQVEI